MQHQPKQRSAHWHPLSPVEQRSRDHGSCRLTLALVAHFAMVAQTPGACARQRNRPVLAQHSDALGLVASFPRLCSEDSEGIRRTVARGRQPRPCCEASHHTCLPPVSHTNFGLACFDLSLPKTAAWLEACSQHWQMTGGAYCRCCDSGPTPAPHHLPTARTPCSPLWLWAC